MHLSVDIIEPETAFLLGYLCRWRQEARHGGPKSAGAIHAHFEFGYRRSQFTSSIVRNEIGILQAFLVALEAFGGIQ